MEDTAPAAAAAAATAVVVDMNAAAAAAVTLAVVVATEGMFSLVKLNVFLVEWRKLQCTVAKGLFHPQHHHFIAVSLDLNTDMLLQWFQRLQRRWRWLRRRWWWLRRWWWW